MAKVIDKVFKLRNISKKDLEGYKSEYLGWKELDEIAVKVVEELIFSEDSPSVGILYDVDTDGVFAGYILEDYLRRHNIEVSRYMNSKKKHGLVNEMVKVLEKEELDWLFIVDAGSGDSDNIRKIVKQGVKVVVLDHHPYDRINVYRSKDFHLLNVSDKESLPKLSGCGVVFRFVEKLGSLLNDLTGQYEKFVGITVLSDMCDMSDKENRYYVRRAYEEYHSNRFLQQFKYYGSGRSFYSFGVVPYINACIRVGEENHIMEIINNMNSRVKMNKVPIDRERVKAKQKKMVAEIKDVSKVVELDGVNLVLRRGQSQLNSVGGLLANEIMPRLGKSCMVLNREGDVWSGSLRSNSFKNSVLIEHGFKVVGHAKACGLEITNEDLKIFLKGFKYEGSVEKPKAMFKVGLQGISDEEWRDLAVFNEYAGIGMPSILVKIKEGIAGAMHVDVESERKREFVYKNNKVLDFTNSKSSNLIVEPVLKGTKYQLIRV